MDEHALIAACLRGQGEEFGRIMDLYASPLMAMALNVLGNREDAEDACQEAFVQAFRHLARYDPARSFRTWLFTILFRRCLDVLKRRRRARSLAAKAGAEPTHRLYVEPAESEGKRDLPRELLRRLSPRERTALALWANEGFTAAEIADIVRCSPATARVYLFNARRKIKSLLENGHGTLGDR